MLSPFIHLLQQRSFRRSGTETCAGRSATPRKLSSLAAHLFDARRTLPPHSCQVPQCWAVGRTNGMKRSFFGAVAAARGRTEHSNDDFSGSAKHSDRTPVAGSAGSWHLPWRMEDPVKFSPRRSPVAKAVRVLEFYVPSFGAAMLSGAPSADDACCSATALHGSGLSSGAPVAAATSAGVMRAHFGARYTWPRRCCAGCRTAAADHLLLETMGCAAVGRSFVMSSNSTEAWDAQECVVIELQHHPCRPFHPHPVDKSQPLTQLAC